MTFAITHSRSTALRVASVCRRVEFAICRRGYINISGVDVLKGIVAVRTKGWKGVASTKMFEGSSGVATNVMQRQSVIVSSSSVTSNGGRDSKAESVKTAFQQGSLGFGFSAGGLLFPYYIGVLYELNDLGIVTEKTKLAGSSAGSLIAACFHAGMSKERITEDCLRLAHDCRTAGTRGRLRSVLKNQLESGLAEDAHERCNETAYVAVTKAFPRLQGILLSEYHCRDDLISALLTSCHIPWWFDNNLVTTFRGQFHCDGGLTNFIPTPPAVKHSVSVSCFPKAQLPAVRDVSISPDTYDSWPFTLNQMLSWAFEPAGEDMLLHLVGKGERDARSWASEHGLLDQAGSGDAPDDLPLVENST